MNDARRIDWRAERERIDLAAVATGLLGPAPGRRGERGRRLWWACPFHKDSNPSFCVEPGKPWWKCWGCGESGDAADLVVRLEGMTFPEAVDYLTGGPAPPRKSARGPAVRPATAPRTKPPARPSGMPEADALALVEAAERRLWSPEGSDALVYLTGPDRCLTREAIRAARLGWTVAGVVGVPYKAPGVTIPWFVGPRLVAVKVRPPDAWRERFPEEERPGKYLWAFRDPSRALCYPGPATVVPGRPLVVAEGELDALCLAQELGDRAAVATLGSASDRPGARALGAMLAAPRWFIATDADTAGDRAAAGWPVSARRVRPPEPFKDWTEAKAAGVDLARWWTEILAGTGRTPLFTWDELSTWRWGPATGDPAPGIIVPPDAPTPGLDKLRAIAAASGDDPHAEAERTAIMAVESGAGLP